MKWIMAMLLGGLMMETNCQKSKGNVRKTGTSTATSESSAQATATGPNAFAWTHALGFAWSGNNPLTPINNGLTGQPLVPGNNNLVVGKNNTIAGSGNAVFGDNNKISGGGLCFRC